MHKFSDLEPIGLDFSDHPFFHGINIVEIAKVIALFVSDHIFHVPSSQPDLLAMVLRRRDADVPLWKVLAVSRAKAKLASDFQKDSPQQQH
jgi:hypothetical protein